MHTPTLAHAPTSLYPLHSVLPSPPPRPPSWQVLNIVYLGGKGKGGFFPAGLNGNIKAN